jgi:hypothetical protein
MQTGFLRNGLQGPALRFELDNLLVSRVATSSPLAALPLRGQWLWRRGRMSFPMISTQISHDSADRRLLPGQERFQARHGVHMQMEAIHNVQGLRSSLSNGLSKAGTAIARDDLDTRVLAKPGGHRFLDAVG